MFNVSVVSYASIVACVCSFLRYPLAVEVFAADMSNSLLAVRAILKHSEHRVDQHTVRVRLDVCPKMWVTLKTQMLESLSVNLHSLSSVTRGFTVC